MGEPLYQVLQRALLKFHFVLQAWTQAFALWKQYRLADLRYLEDMQDLFQVLLTWSLLHHQERS